MTALAAILAGVGLLVGILVNRAAGRFPWKSARLRDVVGRGAVAVPRPVLELGTAALFALVAVRFGASAELPAFLFFASAAVLLAVIDLQHRVLPNRVLVPSAATGAALLTLAAVLGSDWAALLRAGLGAVVLFAVFLVMALVSPRGMGMGDVKLAGLLGLGLGWLGWGAVVVGAAGGFVVQAAVALVLLTTRRIGMRAELPFGPAMLVGAAAAVGWSGALLG